MPPEPQQRPCLSPSLQAVIDRLPVGMTVQRVDAESVWITRGPLQWVQLSVTGDRYAVMRQQERLPEPVAGLRDPQAAVDRLARMLPPQSGATT